MALPSFKLDYEEQLPGVTKLEFQQLIASLQTGIKAIARQLTPPGMGRVWFGANLPEGGWFWCDGGIYQIAEYPDLYAAIGYIYGGNGVTTFAVPDMKGRVAIGAGIGAGLTARILGSAVGEENHVMTAAEMPAHAHPGSTVAITDPGHKHASLVLDTAPAGTSASIRADRGANTGPGAFDVGISSDVTGVTAVPTIASQGGGGGANVVQPSRVCNYIIKY